MSDLLLFFSKVIIVLPQFDVRVLLNLKISYLGALNLYVDVFKTLLDWQIGDFSDLTFLEPFRIDNFGTLPY